MSKDLEPAEKVEPPCRIYYLQSSSGKVYRCYLKSEADKVIAELKAQKAQAEDDCAYWKMCHGNAENAMHETEEYAMQLYNEARHHKYKRCFAMAESCNSKSLWWYCQGSQFEYIVKFWDKWRNRWLKIAEKFKEAK